MSDSRLVPPQKLGERITNADLSLVAHEPKARKFVEYDFPAVEIGCAEYADGPTGITVLVIRDGARMVIDARGGAVGKSSGWEHFAHGITLAGGSIYGLSAGTGVADELRSRADDNGRVEDLRLVSTAVVYDYVGRDNAVFPDARLGRAAVRLASHGRIPVGRVGAGVMVSAGSFGSGGAEFTGQGAGFRVAGSVKALVVTVVNPLGVIVDRSGTIIRGNYDPDTGKRRLLEEELIKTLETGTELPAQLGNTTLTAVVTNAKLTDIELAQFARQVHTSMARAIRPFHTILDGDTLFALTTDEVEVASRSDVSPSIAVGALASEAAWDAVLEAAQ